MGDARTKKAILNGIRPTEQVTRCCLSVSFESLAGGMKLPGEMR